MADNITSTVLPTEEEPVDPDMDEQNLEWVAYLSVVAVAMVVLLVVYSVYRFRHRARYDYTALTEVEDMPAKYLKEKQLAKDTARDAALLSCSFYLRSSPEYRLIDHLPEIGCRPKKHWFLVKTVREHEDRMLTMMPHSDTMIPPFSYATRNTLRDLFAAIKHPYIQPVIEVDFQMDNRQVVIVQPFCGLGSLKDLIHGVRCTECWDYKYCYPGNGLHMHNIQHYGKQILQGVLFLRKRGLPPCGHLHAGNVLVEKDTCRVSGYENTLLGYNNRMTNFLRKPLKKHPAALDTLCFGHLIFEMATGQMLDSPVPTREHYAMVNDEPTTQLLKSIFDESDMPSIEQLLSHEYFAGVSLPKMDVPKVKKTPEVKALLKSYKKTSTKSNKNADPSYKEMELVLVDEGRSIGSSASASSKPRRSSQQAAQTPPPTSQKARRSSSSKPEPSKKPQPVPLATRDLDSGHSAGGPDPGRTARELDPGRSALLSQIRAGGQLRKAPDSINPRV